MCLKVSSGKLIRREIMDQSLRIHPIFVVLGSILSANASDELCRSPLLIIEYFVRNRGDIAETNLPQVFADITIGRIAVNGDVKGGRDVCELKEGSQPANTANPLMHAMAKQFEFGVTYCFCAKPNRGRPVKQN